MLRIAGAIYLVWMGIGMVREALRRTDAISAAPEQDSGQRLLGAWARGLGTNLLNPKVGVFYMAMLPQFLPAEGSHVLMGIAMALVHNAEGMLWFAVIICAAGWAKTWLSRASVRRAMDSLTGTVLVGFGVKLAVASNH